MIFALDKYQMSWAMACIFNPLIFKQIRFNSDSVLKVQKCLGSWLIGLSLDMAVVGQTRIVFFFLICLLLVLTSLSIKMKKMSAQQRAHTVEKGVQHEIKYRPTRTHCFLVSGLFSIFLHFWSLQYMKINVVINLSRF